MENYPRYEVFLNMNNTGKELGATTCTILSVHNLNDYLNATVEMKCFDRVSTITVAHLVSDIFFSGFGVVSNPSKIKGWAGWGRPAIFG